MAKDISSGHIWQKIFNRFNKDKLDYIVVGAVALVIHGMPRSTLDIDIYVPAREETLRRLFQIADSLGLGSEQRDIVEIGHLPKLYVNQWICFSYKGQDVLDIFFAEEKKFSKLYQNSEQRRDKDIVIRVASLNDLRIMKKASARPQDLADLKFIEEVRRYNKIR